MAHIARQDQENRTVEVNRRSLLSILEVNCEKHVSQYEDALEGYTEALAAKIDESFEAAKIELEKRHVAMKAKVASMTEADILKRSDTIVILDKIVAEMKVPRSYENEYRSAIAIATHDVRETLVLSYAEFTCFVRDQWDWKKEFVDVATSYCR